MRSDFHFMRELSSYIHVDAVSRYDRLRQFVTDLDQYVRCGKIFFFEYSHQTAMTSLDEFYMRSTVY